jgi:hypothetical protein
MKHPLRRTEGLLVEHVGDELLILDPVSHQAHSLGLVAAAVWQACDGTRDRAALAAHCSLDLAAVDHGLETLADCDLLTATATATATDGVSRRTALRKAVITGAGIGVAVPLIRTIAVPNAAAQASTSTCVAHSACTLSYNGTSCQGASIFDSCSGQPAGCVCTGGTTCAPNGQFFSQLSGGTCQ